MSLLRASEGVDTITCPARSGRRSPLTSSARVRRVAGVRPVAAPSLSVRLATSVLVVVAGLTACSGSDDPTEDSATAREPSPSASSPSVATEASTPASTATPTASTETTSPATAASGHVPARVGAAHGPDPRAAVRTARGGVTGVRARRPTGSSSASAPYGYDVRRQPVHVPAGNSWGIDVDSGTTTERGRHLARLRPDRATSGRQRPPRHRAAGAGSRGRRVGHQRAARAGPDGGAGRDPSAGRVRGVRRRGAARRRRRPAPLRVAGHGRAYARRPSARPWQGWSRWTASASAPWSPSARPGRGRPIVRGQLVRAGDRAGVPTLACVNASSDHESFEKPGCRPRASAGRRTPGITALPTCPRWSTHRSCGRVGVLDVDVADRPVTLPDAAVGHSVSAGREDRSSPTSGRGWSARPGRARAAVRSPDR